MPLTRRTRAPAREAPAGPPVSWRTVRSCGTPPLTASQNSTKPVGEAKVPFFKLALTEAFRLVCNDPPTGFCTARETCGVPGWTLKPRNALDEEALFASPEYT